MKLIILDRDGVINYDSTNYIKTPIEWVPIPQSLLAIEKLSNNNFKIVIATNQSGIGRKIFTENSLNEIHIKMQNFIKNANGKIDSIFICPHAPNEECKCRKPKPGLLHKIQKFYNIDLQSTYFVGDKLSDAQAALNAGAIPILVNSGLTKHIDYPNIKIYQNLYEFVTTII